MNPSSTQLSVPIVSDYDAQRVLWALAPTMIVDRLTQKIALASRTLEDLFGYSLGGLTKHLYLDLIPPEFHAQHLIHWDNFWIDPKTRTMRPTIPVAIRGIKKDGTLISVMVLIAPCVLAERDMVVTVIIPTGSDVLSHGTTVFSKQQPPSETIPLAPS